MFQGHRPRIALLPIIFILICAGCTDPTGPGIDDYSFVTAVAFFDENGNGVQDDQERMLFPGSQISVLGLERQVIPQTTTGEAIIPFVPAGEQTLVLNEETLPPYFQTNGLLIRVPQDSAARFPVTLPIGVNTLHSYMAFGDSITDDAGYISLLAERLRGHFGRAQVINEGFQNALSRDGAWRIDAVLRRWRPACTLIMFGTNDWNEIECVHEFPGFTIDSLRTIIQETKATQSLPFIATFPPANPANWRIPAARNEWVSRMNALIRQLAAEEGAVLVEVHDAFIQTGDLSQLFDDHVHPNDRGYEIIANQFFEAITQPRGGSNPPVPGI